MEQKKYIKPSTAVIETSIRATICDGSANFGFGGKNEGDLEGGSKGANFDEEDW